jgi:cell division protein FtsN
MNVTSRQVRISPLHRRQHGNTLVGIIIGLVIGLIIAVIVALAITKGSTPFTDKGKAGRSADPTPGQVSDPNKPMYGNKDAAHAANASLLAKEAKAPAAADVAPDGAVNPAAPAPAPAAAPAAAPAPAPAAAAPAATKTDPRALLAGHLGTAAPTTAAAPSTAAAPAAAAHADAGDDKFVYYLQAGAFRDLADAESARAKLALLGFEASVSDRSTDTGVLHRVRMGPYNQVEAMNKVRGKLSENGVDVAVVRNQK